MSHVTVNEAAGFLGVSKATLRNWDRSGKLRATRHPLNGYRVYSLSELRDLRSRLSLKSESPSHPPLFTDLDVRATRGLVSRLHNILRDNDSNSNIIERFDELTKLLFLRIAADCESPSSHPFVRGTLETVPAHASRVRQQYVEAARKFSRIVPPQFAALNGRDQALSECAALLARIPRTTAGVDLLGTAYEEMIRNTFDKTDNQQFFTPTPIVQFMVAMLHDDLHGDICDPAAGTAGFLIEVLKSRHNFSSLTALEIDQRLAWVAGINLLAHGAQDIRSHCLQPAGSLGPEAKLHFGTFDAILTNPPFGSDVTDSSLLAGYRLGSRYQRRRRGILFLERCHALLKNGGKLAFIIDEGVLNLPSTQDVRQFLTKHFRINAIVSLPDAAFMPYAAVNAAILFLEKDPDAAADPRRTFFAKADHVGRKGNGDPDYVYDPVKGRLLKSDLPSIAAQFHNFRQAQEVPTSDLAYVVDPCSNFLDGHTALRLDFRFHHPSRALSRALLDRARATLVSVTQLCSERQQTVIPSSELADQIILYTGLAHIESGSGVAQQVPTQAASLRSAVKRYEPGDVVFARMRPNLRKAAYMDFDEGGYVSPECIVLTVRLENGRPLLDPLLLSVLLRSDLVYGQILHLIAGIGRPRIAARDLRSVLLPVSSHESQQDWRTRYLSQTAAVATWRSKAEELLGDAARMEREAVEHVARDFIET